MSSKPPRIALTTGEPAGIGPDISILLAHQPGHAEIVAIGDPEVLQQRAQQLGMPLRIRPFDASQPACPSAQGTLCVLPVRTRTTVTAGQLNQQNAGYVLETLDAAIEGCQSAMFDAMVTAPLHKGIINDAGIPFSGHTEYLESKCHSPQSVMMLCNSTLRVALVTTHLPLREVSDNITAARLKRVIRVLHADLQRHFALSAPRILVCGLNPHAGEGGHLGHEEIDTIIPVLDDLRAQGMHLLGPLPADTAFTPEQLSHADVVLSMFHDQGLPVLKAQGFGEAVNITLGLSIIRTSVDHGTALDLAGSGKARAGSLLTAIDYANQMVGASRTVAAS